MAMAQREAGTLLEEGSDPPSRKPRVRPKLTRDKKRYGRPTLYQTRIVMLESRITSLKEQIRDALPAKIDNPAVVVAPLNPPAKVDAMPPKAGRTIWALRALAFASGAIIASLLLAYDIIFLETFLSYGDTTSYFPWAWNEYFTSFAPVQNLYLLSVGLSIAALTVAAAGLCIVALKLRRLS
jgi:hypothetical protein